MRSVAVLIVLGVLLAAGCSASVDGPELPAQHGIVPYRGTWEYRYGDSPRRPDGRFEWAQPDQSPTGSDDGWRTTVQTHSPPGRSGSPYLWLRTRLPPIAEGPSGLRQPVLHLDWVEQSFEAYLDGQRIARFGSLDPPASWHFPGFQNHYLPLSTGSTGKLLAIRVHSPHARIGFPTPQHIGERISTLSGVVREGLGPALVGLLLITAGLSLLALYVLQRTETDLLLYSLCLLSLGMYMLCRSTLRSYIVPAAVIWYYVELASLCWVGGFLSLFMARILGPGRLKLLPALAAIFFLYFLVASVLVISGRVHIVNTSEFLKYLLLAFLLTVISRTIGSVLRGELYGRMLGIGFGIAATFASWQVLQEMRILPRSGFLGHYPAVLFAMTLGIILSHRVRDAQRRLADYSALMQLNLMSARELPFDQYAHRVLAELLRILHAQRAVLYTCAEDGSEPKRLAALDSDGNAPQEQPKEDVPAIAAQALSDRRMAVQTRPTSRSTAGGPQGEIAVPLLARDQLLGVLVLQGTAVGLSPSERVLLQGLSRQTALLLLGTRTTTLEQQTHQAQKLLAEQQVLLAQVAGLARGDLQSPITVPTGSQLNQVAGLLDGMRRDLATKMADLAESHAAVQQLNSELRIQIEQRIQHLLEQALSRTSDRARRSNKWLESGDLLGDSYRVIGLLGQGATGSVYDVERIGDGRRLAAKVISTKASTKAQSEAILQFAREAQILARLSDPHVTAIVDVDLTEEGLLFLVMELVQGTPLSQCMDRYRDLRGACLLLMQIAQGLRTVHEHGVVHRDLKPANVLVAQIDGEPQAKLVDFGVSTLRQPDSAPPDAAEQPGVLVGSPMYLAPELSVGSHSAQPPSDIFSVGVIAHQLLTGLLPFSQPPVVSRYRGERLQPPAWTDRRADLPVALASLLSRCLDEDPRHRPTAADLIEGLRAAIEAPTPVAATGASLP